MGKTVALACDHAGFSLKNQLIAYLEGEGYTCRDYGTYDEKSCDYPDYAAALCEGILKGECETGILVCGTGVGMSIAANKFRGIRAACCSDYFSAKYTRLHNDANVLCIGARVVGFGLACELADVFLTAEPENTENHLRRISKLER